MRRDPGRLLWPLAVCVVTLAYAAIPLIGSDLIYLRGDTAAQFAPTWFHLGEMVRGGTWPTWLDTDAWAGGNYAAEALFGIYNPVNLLIWLFVSGSSDLATAVWVVKALALVALALGNYLLSREYGGARWASAAVATALPFSGFTLWWDAGSWAAGLIAFAYAPWVLWSFRRVLCGTLNPFWAFLIGVLAVTQGNPYGTLAVVVVGVGLLCEAAVTRNRAGALWVAGVGASVAAFLPLVYLPLVRTVGLAQRGTNDALFENIGKMRPELGDLFGLSSPTYVPGIQAIVGQMQVPTMYLAWFILPLLPWLRYGVLRRRRAELTGLFAITTVFLVLTLGPSTLWLFRWPLRLVEYLYLGVAVLFAVVLTEGLRRDHPARRLAGTAALVAVAGWLSWAEEPQWTSAAFGGTMMLLALTVVLLLAIRINRTALTALVLIVGTGLVLAGQSIVFEENKSSRVWHFPTDVDALQQRFDGYDGRVMVFSDQRRLQMKGYDDRKLRAQWDNVLAGSMYDVAGVDSVITYTGMGYVPFTRTLCMAYEGFTKPCGYRRLWESPVTGEPSLADLMKLDTVVVQPSLVKNTVPPPDWRVVQEEPVLVLERTSTLPWPDSELSYASDGVDVESATSSRYEQQVDLTVEGDDQAVVFALLDWPGYTATLDGQELPVTHNSVGLLTVELPDGADGTLEVTYRPPGLLLGLACAGLGTLAAVVMGLLWWRRRRVVA